MKQTASKQRQVVIFPCSGSSVVGRLTLLAAQELILEGKGEWGYLKQFKDEQKLANETSCGPVFIVVDGCEKKCAGKYLAKLQYDAEFHLSLTDLGIENLEGAEIGDDDLQLVKDAIIAESTRLSERPPGIPGGCSCR